MKTLERSQQSDLLPMELPLMQSVEASRVKISALLGSRPVSETEPEADCGQKSPVLLANFDPASSLWRTSQTCLVALLNGQEDGLGEFSETWPRSGMMRNGIAYQLPPLVPLTDATACGSWPTPATRDHHAQGATMNTKARSASLATVVQKMPHLWPTPTKHNAKETNAPSEALRNTPTLAAQVGGHLNPTWVEWLMGFPLGHTDLQHLETP
jgi:hypothetical protein